MKISEKQLYILVSILSDTIQKNVVGLFKYDIEARVQLFNEITNQQSTELVEVDPKGETETRINLCPRCKALPEMEDLDLGKTKDGADVWAYEVLCHNGCLKISGDSFIQETNNVGEFIQKARFNAIDKWNKKTSDPKDETNA